MPSFWKFVSVACVFAAGIWIIDIFQLGLRRDSEGIYTSQDEGLQVKVELPPPGKPVEQPVVKETLNQDAGVEVRVELPPPSDPVDQDVIEETMNIKPEQGLTEQLDQNLFYSRDTSQMINLKQAKPPDYLKNYKNPCWEENKPSTSPYKTNLFYHSSRQGDGMKDLEALWESETNQKSSKQIRCLPYFYIAGFPKCGTSDLFNKLILHPDVTSPPKKEIHWWSWIRDHEDKSSNTWTPISMYADLFDAAARNISMNTVTMNAGKEYHPMIVGEGSPSTVWYNGDFAASQNDSFPAHYIHHVTPEAKIIILVRNPSSRLYSSYIYFGSYGSVSPEDFHEKCVRAIAAFDICMAGATSHWDCVYNRTVIRQSPLSELRVGMYYYYIEKYLEIFPREQVMILRLEDYGTNRSGVLKDVFDFLGLRSLNKQEMSEIDQAATTNQSSGKKKTEAGSMLPKTKQLLDNFYSKYNKALAELLHDDKFLYS